MNTWRHSAWRSKRKVHDGAPILFEEWASQIRSVLAKGATNTLELARIVCQARQSLRYGVWAQMWSSREALFSKRKAEMLVSVAKHLGELDAQTFAHLPTGWSVLYCLSLLGATVVKRLLGEGVIHSGLSLREARELLAEHRDHRGTPGSKRFNVAQRLGKFQTFVLDTMNEWTPTERALVCDELALLVEKIVAHDAGHDFDRLLNQEDERAAKPVSIRYLGNMDQIWRHNRAF